MSDRWSTSEIADAVFALLDCGVSRGDIQSGALDATLALAAAGDVTPPQAGKIAASAARRFALSGADVLDVADISIASSSTSDVLEDKS
jgi:hypothetical protein